MPAEAAASGTIPCDFPLTPLAFACEISHSRDVVGIKSFSLRLTPARRAWLALGGVWLVAALGAALVAGEAARRSAEAELIGKAEAAAALHAAVLRSELEKHRSLPVALAGDPDIALLLAGPTPDQAERINRKLEGLAFQTRAAAIYLIDANGLTRASSNWRMPTSFVGANYAFRPYFINAMRNGAAEFFALGTVSGRPGLYLARGIDRPGRAAGRQALGVVVVKVEFDALEAEWRGSGEIAYVADPRGIILITSRPDWRFRTLSPLDDRSRRLALINQTLGPEALGPLPFATPTADELQIVKAAVDGAQAQWMHAQTGTATPGWTLHLLAPGRSDGAQSASRTIAALIVTLLAGLAGILLRRRQQAEGRVRAEAEARTMLERRIDERTRELREANAALNRQIEERRRAEAARELMRNELVQASKLAALGQIAAGVAHEINQPVAAIQTQAETAQVYLERNQPEGATSALARIGNLTRRIGAITQELRTFARKSAPELGPVNLDDAIDGALLLLDGPLREKAVRLDRVGCAGVSVLADRFRVEQVIVNLVQNAANAFDDTDDPVITLSARGEGGRVAFSVADNGPGVPADIRSKLFTPFTTTRPNGLGLGLVICRDIVAGFGGELNMAPSERGATFVLTLNAA